MQSLPAARAGAPNPEMLVLGCCRGEEAADLSAFQREYEDDHSWEQLQEDEYGRLRPLVSCSVQLLCSATMHEPICAAWQHIFQKSYDTHRYLRSHTNRLHSVNEQMLQTCSMPISLSNALAPFSRCKMIHKARAHGLQKPFQCDAEASQMHKIIIIFVIATVI